MYCRNNLEPICTPAGMSIALGYFDGVHHGHRTVIESAVIDAQARGTAAGVFTFAQPETYAVKGKILLTQTEKMRRMQQLGAEYYICPEFEEFCGFSPERFVKEILAQRFAARAVFCGEDFTFGKNKAGNVQMLRALCAQCGIDVTVLPLVQQGGDTVSSSRIRRCLAEGRVEEANSMLDEPYAIDLPVRHGKKLGTALGFPTINQIYPEGMLIPREGVYITRVFLGGKWLPSATGLGTRPTVNGSGVTCETFIPDFSGDIYGENVRVRFCSYLWPTERFDSLDSLAAMVQRAAKAAKEWREPPENA